MAVKIHHTVGLYPNGDIKENGVPAEELEGHVNYNVTYRPGRALFVDGVCVHRGIGVVDRLIDEWTEKLKDRPVPPVRYPRH